MVMIASDSIYYYYSLIQHPKQKNNAMPRGQLIEETAETLWPRVRTSRANHLRETPRNRHLNVPEAAPHLNGVAKSCTMDSWSMSDHQNNLCQRRRPDGGSTATWLLLCCSTVLLVGGDIAGPEPRDCTNRLHLQDHAADPLELIQLFLRGGLSFLNTLTIEVVDRNR